MGKRLSDSEIVELFFARDEAALRALSENYGQYLSSVAQNVLKNREDCAECLNDVYLALWNRIPPEKPENLRAYAAKAVRNAALRMYQRKTRGGKTESLPIEELTECLADERSIEDECDARVLRELLNAFVRSLNEKERYIFVCRYYYSDSISSIARALHVSEKTVYKHLARMRTGLAEQLRKDGLSC